MSVRRVENPGEGSTGPRLVAMPCMCWHSWGSDPFELDLRDQAAQMIVQGEAMIAAGRALRETAEREAGRQDQ
jgi:hypothetical protein